MNKFFENFDTLQQTTAQLGLMQNSFQCAKCLKEDQFVSHGFIHKKSYGGVKKISGKRILCSNRYGRSGCGHSFRIYIKDIIPSLSYSTTQLFDFLKRLLAGSSIKDAYKAITNSENPRNAYRWINKLQYKTPDYRTFIIKHSRINTDQFKARVSRFQILLPTLQNLFSISETSNCAQYQTHIQRRFI